MYVGEKVKVPERPDIVTWDLLARGWKLYYEMTKESLAAAEKILRKAVANAPTSCDAHYILAGVLSHQVFMGFATDMDAFNSEAYMIAKLAVSLDEKNEYAHWTLGVVAIYQGKSELAIAEHKRAIEINPNCSLAYGSLGTVLSYVGDPDESIKNSEIAIRLNPRDPSIFFRYSAIAMAHFRASRYAEASQWALKAVHRKPSWRLGHAVLASSFSHLNLLKEAKEAVNNYLEHFPNETISGLRKVFPIKRPADVCQFEEGLRMAGLPE
jgi:tetratricopeptide (TPR) repeat protein